MVDSFYIQRISKVIDHIEENIGEKLPLDELSEIAMFSKYHFHRIFKTVTGETLHAFIKRIRMVKAYRQLQVDKFITINELSGNLGYNSVANFSRTFKEFHGCSPSEVKLSGNSLQKRQKFNTKGLDVRFERVEQINDKFLIYKKITTGYCTERIPSTFNSLYELALQHKFPIKQFIGIGYDDPDYTPPDKCKYDACIVVEPKDIPKDISFNTKVLKGGRYAVFYFEGHKHDIFSAWDYIFKEWLLNSDYIPDDRPHLEMYLYSDECHLGIFKVNLCLPVKLRQFK